MVVADLDASLLIDAPVDGGSARRPELYWLLAERTGQEEETRERFGSKGSRRNECSRNRDTEACTRRSCLQLAAGSIAVTALDRLSMTSFSAEPMPTKFQIACMTLPYSQFPLERALPGIKQAGYESSPGERRTANRRRETRAGRRRRAGTAGLGKSCRDLGLEPVMMFSMIYPEEARGSTSTQRIPPAVRPRSSGPHLRPHRRGQRKVWVERFKSSARLARDNDVTLVVKQHGGATGTGAACAEITARSSHCVKVNYDAGNVMDYPQPRPDRRREDVAGRSAQLLHQGPPQLPERRGLRPGLRRDRSLQAAAPVVPGRTMPLCCENIFAPRCRDPRRPKESTPWQGDVRVLETVTAGLQVPGIKN